MTTQSIERLTFVADLTRELPDVPTHRIAALARELSSAATRLHRLAELACSSEAADRDRVPCPAAKGLPCLCDAAQGHESVPRIAVTAARIERQVTRLLAEHGISPIFQRDPRGAVFKLKVPSGKTDDWSREGLCVPSR